MGVVMKLNTTMVVAMQLKLKSNMSMILSLILATGKLGVPEKTNGKFHGLVGTNKECKNITCISLTSNVTPKVKFGVMEATMLVISTFLVNATGCKLDSLSTSNIMELTL